MQLVALGLAYQLPKVLFVSSLHLNTVSKVEPGRLAFARVPFKIGPLNQQSGLFLPTW